MSELPVSTEPSLSPDSPSKTPSQQAGLRLPNNGMHEQNKWLKFVVVGLIVLALLLVGQWWNSRTQTNKLRAEIARRLQVGDSANTETKVIAKAVHDDMKELQAKVGVLENRQAETQSQQVSLAQLYQDMSKNRDDWALAEIEQVLSTANQQLQLSGNVQGALIALQNADKTLSRSEKPQFIVIRRALAKDIEKLRAFPILDVAGATLRLDSVIGEIQALPLLSGEKLPQGVSDLKTPDIPAAGSEPSPESVRGKAAQWWAGAAVKWQAWARDMWNELRVIIRVRNVETPEALLLSPTQAYYLRENLELRLLSARFALLSRNDASFRSDMKAAQNIIGKYFDPAAKQTQAVLTILKQVEASNLSIEMPNLTESLTAVQNYRAKP